MDSINGKERHFFQANWFTWAQQANTVYNVPFVFLIWGCQRKIVNQLQLHNFRVRISLVVTAPACQFHVHKTRFSNVSSKKAPRACAFCRKNHSTEKCNFVTISQQKINSEEKMANSSSRERERKTTKTNTISPFLYLICKVQHILLVEKWQTHFLLYMTLAPHIIIY